MGDEMFGVLMAWGFIALLLLKDWYFRDRLRRKGDK